MSVETPRLLTVAEVADVLRQSRQTIWRKVATGELHAYRLGADGPLRVEADEVSRYLREAGRPDRAPVR